MNVNNEMLVNGNTDIALSNILSNFDTGYILDIVRDSINKRFRPYATGMPGLNAIEMNFRNLESGTDDSSQKRKIIETRARTYSEIINILCQYYNLTYIPNEDTDDYAVAYFLYDILVANYTSTIINFFVRYIHENKDNIYAAASADNKITKDDTSSYSKKIYTDPKMGYIHSNIAKIMDNIAVSDITMDKIVHYGYGDPNCERLLGMCVNENSHLFLEHFAPILQNPSTRADLITAVRLALQKYSNADMSIIVPNMAAQNPEEV